MAATSRSKFCQILPGGRVVLFTVLTGGQPESLISVASLDTGERNVVIPGGTRPYYVPDRGSPGRGHIVYTHGEELLASAFDLRRLEVTGPPRRIAAGVRTGLAGGAQVAVSPDGTLVYVSGSPSEQKVLVWVDRGGIEETLVGEPERFWFPRLSPDGTRVIVTTVIGGNFDVWIYELAERPWERLTFDPAFDDANSPTNRIRVTEVGAHEGFADDRHVLPSLRSASGERTAAYQRNVHRKKILAGTSELYPPVVGVVGADWLDDGSGATIQRERGGDGCRKHARDGFNGTLELPPETRALLKDLRNVRSPIPRPAASPEAGSRGRSQRRPRAAA